MGIAVSSVVPRLLRRPQWPLQLPFTTRTPARHLPDDLVLDVLSRIPVKSLCRFRCVSKRWQALISNAIVAAYKSHGVPLLVVGSDHQSLLLIDMDGNVVKSIRNAAGSAVWRLICTSSDSLVCVIGLYCEVRVIDLATGEVLQTCRRNGLQVVFWPLPGELLGFGRAVPSGVYKLVYINRYTCEILTVGDASGWRPMQPPPTTNNISYTSNPVVVNGVLHFMLKSQLDGNSVLCFDLEREEWKKEGIKGPADVEELHHQRDSDPALCELNGSLCMVQPEDQSYGISNNNIWLLSDYDENAAWVKVLEVPFDSYRYDRLIPLRILRDGERLLFCSTRKNTDLWSVQIYDPHSWELTDLPNALAGVHGTNFIPCS